MVLACYSGVGVNMPGAGMKSLVRATGLLAVMLAVGACSEEVAVGETGAVPAPPAVAAGVSEELARARAALITGLHYRLRFEIPADEAGPIAVQAVISFELAANAVPLQLDFRQGEAAIRSLRINGAAAKVELAEEHILLPVAALRPGHNEVAINLIAGDSSLNRNPDFLYTLFVPDRARSAFPLFDQPDLKARFELSLVVPAGWLALGNGPLAQRIELDDGRWEYHFAPTDLISSYLFSFVAGNFQAITREVNGRTMTMLHRETDSAKLARNVDAIFALHGESLDWLEHYTAIPYPFSKFDFVLIPGFPFGGMEHVGAIQYRAESLLLDASPPLTDTLRRAHLIAHETAHMWFGDLVTMRWFDDVWTKEVFANFLADKMVNPGFPEVDHALNFLVTHYPAAYAVDRSEGANPIRQALPNLNQAGQLYGSIIYHKAPIMMRQLELILGEESLRGGLGEYLRQFAYGNATWPDLIRILDARTDTDLAAWSEVWVNTAGRPRFREVPAAEGAQGPRALQQLDPAGLGRVWPQQFELLRLYADGRDSLALVAAEPASALPPPPGGETPVASLFNADGLGYGLFPLDPDILGAWDRLQPVQRGSALVNAWDNLLAGLAVDSAVYYGQLLAIVRNEQDPLLLTLALGQLQYLYQVLLDDAQQSALAVSTEEQLWATLEAQPDSSRRKLVFRYYAALASSAAGVQRLYDIWSGELAVDKLVLAEEDRTELAQTLAIRLPVKSENIIARQLASIDNPDRRRRLAFIAPSLAADEAVRDAFFASLREPKNRRTENWVKDAVANLHHPSRRQQAEKYLLPSLELLEEIQVTGDIFFPSHWLQSTLANHNSAPAAQTVRQFLAQRPDYNPQLRMKILQAADGLFRASAIRARQESPTAQR